MNNLYRQLAEEASKWCIENAKGTPVAWEWEDKFAELIVEKCLSIVEYPTGDSEWDGYSEATANLIRRNFGVEK